MMSLWRQLSRGIRALSSRAAADRDVTDELQHYLEQSAAAYRARGYSPEQALHAARLEVGNMTNVREQVRGAGWEHGVETLARDLRFAARRLRAEPGFTAITVLTMALGVGATTAIFSAVNPILLEPLPYRDPSRVAAISEVGRDGARVDGTFGMYSALRQRSRTFEAMGAFRSWRPTMTGPGQPERFEGQRVSAPYFRILGVAPVLGRDFLASEDEPGAPDVVILSDALWRRRFGADRSVIGRAITLDDRSVQVIGVMPARFENVLAPAAELWSPLQYHMSQGRAWGHHLRLVGRLRAGVGTDDAVRELDAIGNTVLDEQHPETYGDDVKFSALALQDDVTRAIRPALLAVLGAVLLVLIIACVNVTSMLLARGVRRQGEFALRAALGAGGSRLIRQLLTESALLALMGGVVGIAVAQLGVQALIALSPDGLPRMSAIRVDGAVLAFGVGITALIGIAVGVMPALHAQRSDPQAALQRGSRRTQGGHRLLRNALVVAEVALALMLLVSSGLLARSLGRLFAVESGFDASRVLTMQVHTSGARYAADSSTYRFFAGALDAVRRVPGVTVAGLTSQLPLSGDFDLYGVRFEPGSPDDAGELGGSFRYAVSPGYLEAMRIPLLRGRLLEESDRAGAPLVAVISESMAKRRLPGLDPIGQRLRVGGGELYTVVGVAGDVKQLSLAVNEADAVYITAEQWRFADDEMTLVVRARDEPASLVSAVREAVWSVDKDQPISRVATMEELVARSAAERRFAVVLFEAFALAALALAAAGIYGVLAGSVAERTREIGVRSALGASRSGILRLVVGQGMTVTGIGALLGVAGAVAAGGVINSMLFGVTFLDPLTWLAVLALLAGVAMIACLVPAWRAARVDPASTLRTE
jgi:putative ABC transport system permease protein